MNSFAIAFLLANAILLLLLPRRWAPMPLLIGTCYMTLSQGIDIGPFTFTIIRILIAVGFARVIIRREKMVGKLNGLDKLMLVLAGWTLFSSVFHDDLSSAVIYRLGLVYNVCGIYFLFRVYCQSFDDLIMLFRILALVLMPVAAEMFYENVATHNLFSVLGGVSETPVIRDGRIRAQGPFAHSILAGTVGAVSLPLMIGLWKQQHRREALIGILACFAMIMFSSSSGPILSGMAGIGALFTWHFRHKMRLIRWTAVIGYIGLDLVMKAPAYYLMSRFSPIGASTGWHRARLIESAIIHINEWWLGGTDYTRHWMPTGVSWSPNHTDITNYYIKMGVIGGLPLMMLLIIILTKAFFLVGKTIRTEENFSPEARFMIWTMGASLFAHAASCSSVSYFDQSFLFLYLILAAIGSASFGKGKLKIMKNDVEIQRPDLN